MFTTRPGQSLSVRSDRERTAACTCACSEPVMFTAGDTDRPYLKNTGECTLHVAHRIGQVSVYIVAMCSRGEEESRESGALPDRHILVSDVSMLSPMGRAGPIWSVRNMLVDARWVETHTDGSPSEPMAFMSTATRPTPSTASRAYFKYLWAMKRTNIRRCKLLVHICA